MKRREFIGLLGGAAAAWPIAAIAQQPEKIPRIGYLSPSSAMARERDEPFRQALRELGYVASMQYTLRMHMDLVRTRIAASDAGK